MRYRQLGSSGLRVSEVGYGTMTFGQGRGSWGATKEESLAVFRHFVDAGGNFFDSANTYQAGESESFLGEFIADERHRYVISTKYSMGLRPGDPNAWGNHRKSLVQAVEGSLQRLKTDYIDLYWAHVWDRITPQEEVLRALDDLVRAGKILYIGLSDTPAWVISRSQAIAELRGWSTLAAVQMPYSLVERSPERELIPMATGLGLGLVTWGGLGAGLLSGKYNDGARSAATGRLTNRSDRPRDDVLSNRNLQIAREVESVAASRGMRASQVALAWVRSKSPSIVPVLGARTAQQLAENLACTGLSLDAESLARLDAVSAIALGFPSEFLDSDMIDTVLYQNMRDRIEPRLAFPKT